MGVDLNDLRIARDTAGESDRRRWPWLVGALAVFGGLAAAAAFFLPGRESGEAVEVRTAVVSVMEGPGPAPRAFTAGGWIEPAFPWPLVVSALTAERLERLKVQEGDAVAEGEVVAELWDRDLRDEVRRAEAQRDLARASLALLEAGTRAEEIAEAKARLRELEADRDLLERVAKRSRLLCEGEAISDEQAERDEAAHEAAKARVEAQAAVVARLEAGPRAEEIDAARAEAARREAELDLAKQRLAYAEVRAPRAGTVYRLLAAEGERLTPEKPFVLSLYDPGSLWVRVDVAQADVGKVERGQTVEVRTEAEPERSIPGEVVRLDPQADFAKNTITVRVALKRTGGRLHPDMTARVHFHARGLEEGAPEPGRKRVLVPRTAVVTQGGRTVVYEVVDGAARLREVELGGTLGDAVEVLRGVGAGAAVIVGGLENVTDGARVRERK